MKNEGNFRLNSNAAETFYPHEITKINCLSDFQRYWRLHVVIQLQNEGNFRLSWNTAETFHLHEITKISRLSDVQMCWRLHVVI